MSILRVWDGATGAGDGSTWADAYTSIQAALTARAATDHIWVASDHVDFNTVGAGNINYTCSSAAYNDSVVMISVNRTTDAYEVAASDQVAGTGTLTISFSCNMFGLYLGFTTNFTAKPTGDDPAYMTDCNIVNNSASGAHYFYFTGADLTDFILINCNFSDLGSTNSYFINQYSNIKMIGGSVSIGTLNGKLFYSSKQSLIDAEGVDFTGTTFSTNPLVNVSNNSYPNKYIFTNCKIPSGIVITDVSSGNPSHSVEIISTDSAGDISRYELYNGRGESSITTTSVYRDAGFIDADSNRFSLKLSSASVTDKYIPQRTRPILGAVKTTGSVTFTVEIAEDFTVGLTDAECFIELQYLGTVSDTLTTLVSSAPSVTNAFRNPLVAGSTLATSSEAWTGAGSLNKRKITKTVTINQKGMYSIRVYLGKYEAGKSLYVDPLVVVS
jgi:hypothetical protein